MAIPSSSLLQKQEKTSSGKLEEQLKGDKQWSLITVSALYREVFLGTVKPEFTCWFICCFQGEKNPNSFNPFATELKSDCQWKIKNENHGFNSNEKCSFETFFPVSFWFCFLSKYLAFVIAHEMLKGILTSSCQFGKQERENLTKI